MRVTLILILILSLMMFSSCEKDRASEEFRLGTVCRITTSGKVPLDTVWDGLSSLEQCLSTHLPDSELQALNARSGEGWVSVSPLLYRALAMALEMADVSDGAFNPAIGAMVRLWDIGGENQRIPSEDEISTVLPHVDWHQIELDGVDSVRILDPLLQIDLGGLGKGLAADLAVSSIRGLGGKKALLNFGGNIACLGGPYRIGIQVPFGERGQYSEVLGVSDLNVVTSGAYEKNFTGADGVLYHHVIDSFTGHPSRSDLASATVIGPEGVVCDMLSTACFVLGSVRSASLLADFPEYSAVLILSDGSDVVVGNDYRL